jgi:hypothetical protein
MLFLCYAYHVIGEPSISTADTRYVFLNDKGLSMLLHQRQCLLPNMKFASRDDFQTVFMVDFVKSVDFTSGCAIRSFLSIKL